MVMVDIRASGLYTLYRLRPDVVSASRRKFCESQKSLRVAEKLVCETEGGIAVMPTVQCHANDERLKLGNTTQ